ncbi:histidine phosphatase family protein [Sulfurimonas sp. HSL-1716]|uniref:SixA phosphatase family protein n=1 Tax=Hydrocurvibacter sulfurireducens TaxID=3131937 RepID=UPI0031F8AC6D
MKRFYFIRHAKSSWKDLALDDYDRPLNKRGEKDAPFMGALLRKKGVIPDLIISSPALRAKRTAQIIAEAVNFTKPIVYEERIYEADVKDLQEIIENIDHKYKTVFIIGHNPGLNMFIERLVGFHENIPTCGIVEIDPQSKELISFDYPKRYR